MEGRGSPLVCPWVRVLVLVATAMTVLAACGEGDRNAGDSVITSTSTSSTTVPERCVTELERGCQGQPVNRLQRLLRERVIAGLAVDGDFGPATENALRQFEGQRCGSACVVDGRIVVDGSEWLVLVGLTPTTTEPRELSP